MEEVAAPRSPGVISERWKYVHCVLRNVDWWRTCGLFDASFSLRFLVAELNVGVDVVVEG